MEIESQLPDVGKVFERVQLCSALRRLLFFVGDSSLKYQHRDVKEIKKQLSFGCEKGLCLPTYFTSKPKIKNVRNLNSVQHIDPF